MHGRPCVGIPISDETALEMRFSLNGKASWSEWEASAPTKQLVLPGSPGVKTIWAEFRDQGGRTLQVSDTIELVAP